MDTIDRDISAALSNGNPIPREKVLAWITAAKHLSTLGKLYRLTGECYGRIQPDLGQETTCSLIQRYLFECIRQNLADSEEIQERWEAAGTLHAWFCHLVERNDTSQVLTNAAAGVTELFLDSGEEVRLAIEQGFLEHALEMESLRPYFVHWSAHNELRPAWESAMEWGKAHPGYTWGLLQQLRGMN